jgi:hypothetical protein
LCDESRHIDPTSQQLIGGGLRLERKQVGYLLVEFIALEQLKQERVGAAAYRSDRNLSAAQGTTLSCSPARSSAVWYCLPISWKPLLSGPVAIVIARCGIVFSSSAALQKAASAVTPMAARRQFA